jgi:hypothetical protein
MKTVDGKRNSSKRDYFELTKKKKKEKEHIPRAM